MVEGETGAGNLHSHSLSSPVSPPFPNLSLLCVSFVSKESTEQEGRGKFRGWKIGHYRFNELPGLHLQAGEEREEGLSVGKRSKR